MDYKALGKRIRAKRHNLGFTQEALAEKTSLSPSFLGHIERGSRKASLETLVKIANALHTDANNLLADSLCVSNSPRYTDREVCIKILEEIMAFVKSTKDE